MKVLREPTPWESRLVRVKKMKQIRALKTCDGWSNFTRYLKLGDGGNSNNVEVCRCSSLKLT